MPPVPVNDILTIAVACAQARPRRYGKFPWCKGGKKREDGQRNQVWAQDGGGDKLASELIRLPSSWWPRPDSNRHSGFPEADFKSAVSTVPPRGPDRQLCITWWRLTEAAPVGP